MRSCATGRGPSSLAAGLSAVLLLVESTLLVAGCGAPKGPPDVTFGGEDVSGRCARGQLVGASGTCMQVGIQECTDLFMEDDHLCYPSMAKCPPGAIPKFDEGCIPVGIPRCAPEFVDDDGVCRPTSAKCPTGTFAAPEAGCLPLDGPRGCGRGPWGGVPSAPGDVHVDRSYSGGDSDGSEARPFTSLAAALERVEEGGTIVLAEGTYEEPLVITRPLTIAGACASRVRIQGVISLGVVPAVVTVFDAGEVTLKGVEIGGEGVGVVVTGASAVSLERVHVKGALHGGIVADDGARLSITRSLIEGTRSIRSAYAGAGAGVLAEGGAALRIEESAVIGNRATGIAVRQAGTTAAVVGSLVEGTLPAENLALGEGIVVRDGAEASIERSAVVANRMSGVLALLDASATLSGVLVERTLSGPEALSHGIGVYAAVRSRVAIDGSLVLDNVEAGVASIGAGAHMTMERSLVAGTTAPVPPVLGGVGAIVARGATMHLHHSSLWKNHASGVHVGDSSAELVAVGNLIEGTLAGGTRGSGEGVTVAEGIATLTSNAVRDNEGTGVLAAYLGSHVTMTGNLIAGHVAPDRGAPVGQGVVIHRGAGAVLTGNVIQDNRSVGVLLGTDGPGGEVEMRGNLVQNTSGGEEDGSAGIGIAVAGYRLRLADSVVRTSRTAGVALFSAEADIQRTVIDEVTGDPRAMKGGPRTDVVSDGILALAGSTARLHDVRVSGCARAGVLYDQSAGRLSGVRASSNLFGLVVQGSPAPHVEKDNVFIDNTAQDELAGGELPVRLAAPRLP